MNKIRVTGSVLSNPTYSHTVYGEKFYNFSLICGRLSGAYDTLCCEVSEVLISNITLGTQIELSGEIRTRNYTDNEGKRKCDIKVFVEQISQYDGLYDENEVTLSGFICKEPQYRTTPLGRNIADVLVASNRIRSHKSDYIPCIAWGRNALRVSQMAVGTKVDVIGRLQSREYIKVLPDGTKETKVAYELSICKIKESETDEN